MNKIYNPIYIKRLSVICAFSYMVSYLTRLNFATVTVEIIRETGWEISAVAAPTTALFVFYGAGQFVSGYLGDRMRPEILIFSGLAFSSLMNFSIPFCATIPQMTVIWGLNGFAQAMLWPPIARILSGACDKKDYQKSTMKILRAATFGTVFNFLLAALCTATVGWRALFFINGSVALIYSVLFVFMYRSIKIYSRGEENARFAAKAVSEQTSDAPVEAVEKMPVKIWGLLSMVLLATIALGSLRDSIQSWLPTFVAESFDIDGSTAMLTSVIMPLIIYITYPFFLKYYRRFFKSEIACASTFFAASATLVLILYFVSGVSPVLSVLLLALSSTCMNGVNFLLIGLLPNRFEKYGNVSTIAGIINGFVYVGSSLSVFVIAVIAEKFGWKTTIITWVTQCTWIYCLRGGIQKFQKIF